MGRPFTLLEDLCTHARAHGSQTIAVQRKDGREWVFGRIDGETVTFTSFPSSGNDAKELREGLYRAHKKPLRTVLSGQACVLKVRIVETSDKDAFEVMIEPSPKLDPATAPRFTKTQGQYLAYIFSYTKIHRVAPAESDLQRYFQVSPPSVHEMIKTLERNGLIERTPGHARSIRLLVQPEHLPQLT